MASLSDILNFFFLALLGLGLTLFAVPGFLVAFDWLMAFFGIGPLGDILLLLFISLYLVAGVAVFSLAKKIGVKVECIVGIAKTSLIVYLLATIPLYFVSYIVTIPPMMNICSDCAYWEYDECIQAYYGTCPCKYLDESYKSYNSLNPFSVYPDTLDDWHHITYCSFVRRYLVYLGPHNPITLFLGGLLLWKWPEFIKR